MEVLVTQAAKEDEKIIEEFLKIAYKDRWQFKYPDRWYWEFVNNPYWAGDKLPIWIALQDGRLVGQTCAMYSPLMVGGYLYKVAWSVDTIVLPECRGGRIGNRLQRASANHNKIFMSLSMSEANRRIKIKFGSIPVDPVCVYTKRMSYHRDTIYKFFIKRAEKNAIIRKLTHRIVRVLLIDGLLAFLANTLVDIHNVSLKNKAKANTTKIRRIENFDCVQSLWEKTKNQYDVIVVRDAQYLNWKFVRQPHMDYKKFTAERGGETKGYIVFRKGQSPERNIGIIADLYAAKGDKETLEALIASAVDFFGKSVELIECATTVEEYKRAYLNLGFVKIKEVVPMFYSKEDFPGEDIITKHGSWFLNRGDHDWDQYPLA